MGAILARQGRLTSTLAVPRASGPVVPTIVPVPSEGLLDELCRPAERAREAVASYAARS